mgnify:CR=1 FL=1
MLAAAVAQQRGGLRWEVQAADAGAEGVLRRAFFGRNLAAEPFVASVPDRCAKNILYGAVIAAVCVACAHMHL